MEEKLEDGKMKSVSRSGRNFLLLFVCGFLIGINLEIFLIERHKNESNFQRELKEKIGVDCLILIKHKHDRYVNISKKTWLKRCDSFNVVNVQKLPKPSKLSKNSTDASSSLNNYFNSSKQAPNRGETLNIFANSAWSGLCKALLWSVAGNNEWLIIVPDNVMVLVENLKLFVRNLNSEHFYYLGYPLEYYEGNYNTLSAGILLSRGTLKKLFLNIKSEKDCDEGGKYWKNEDKFLGKYLKEINILPQDTRDEEGRGRFHGFNANNLLWPGKLFVKTNYFKTALFPAPQGFKCCSRFLITLPVSDPDSMYSLFYFFYKVKSNYEKIPPIKPKPINKSLWKDFLREEGYSEKIIENMTSEEYYKIWEKKLPPEKAYKEMRNFIKQKKLEN